MLPQNFRFPKKPGGLRSSWSARSWGRRHHLPLTHRPISSNRATNLNPWRHFHAQSTTRDQVELLVTVEICRDVWVWAPKKVKDFHGWIPSPSLLEDFGTSKLHLGESGLSQSTKKRREFFSLEGEPPTWKCLSCPPKKKLKNPWMV